MSNKKSDSSLAILVIPDWLGWI